MKWLRILCWIIVPYIIIFVEWKKLKKNSRILAFVWIGVVAVIIATSSSGKENATTNSTPMPKPSVPSQTQPVETPVAILGEPLTSFDKVLGKANVNETFHRYKDDYVLVMPMNDLAWNITVQFESTDKQRRSKEEALAVAKEYIPQDAAEVKQWQVEKGKDVIQYESKSLASKFDASVFGETPAGTFMVIVKSDDKGVFSLVIAPGNNP